MISVYLDYLALTKEDKEAFLKLLRDKRKTRRKKHYSKEKLKK